MLLFGPSACRGPASIWGEYGCCTVGIESRPSGKPQEREGVWCGLPLSGTGPCASTGGRGHPGAPFQACTSQGVGVGWGKCPRKKRPERDAMGTLPQEKRHGVVCPPVLLVTYGTSPPPVLGENRPPPPGAKARFRCRKTGLHKSLSGRSTWGQGRGTPLEAVGSRR